MKTHTHTQPHTTLHSLIIPIAICNTHTWIHTNTWILIHRQTHTHTHTKWKMQVKYIHKYTYHKLHTHTHTRRKKSEQNFKQIESISSSKLSKAHIRPHMIAILIRYDFITITIIFIMFVSFSLWFSFHLIWFFYEISLRLHANRVFALCFRQPKLYEANTHSYAIQQ